MLEAADQGAPLGRVGLTAGDGVADGFVVRFTDAVALTIGMRELAAEHLQSGVANTANALAQLLGLGFGPGAGRSIRGQLVRRPAPGGATPAFSGTHVVAALAAGLAFTVTTLGSTRS